MIIIITIVVVEGGGEDMYRGGFICEETSDVRSLFCCACTWQIYSEKMRHKCAEHPQLFGKQEMIFKVRDRKVF